jgi:hypothetical protein
MPDPMIGGIEIIIFTPEKLASGHSYASDRRTAYLYGLQYYIVDPNFPTQTYYCPGIKTRAYIIIYSQIIICRYMKLCSYFFFFFS